MIARVVVLLAALSVILQVDPVNSLVNCNTLKTSRVAWVPCGFRQSQDCIQEGWECDRVNDCEDGSDEAFCGISGNNVFHYEYKYTSDVSFPDKSDGLYISATVLLDKQSNGRKILTTLTLKDPKLRQKNDKSKTNLLKKTEQDQWEKPIQYNVSRSGRISNIQTLDGEEADILNIKKSIASIFQMRLRIDKTKYETTEADPTGTCNMKYTINSKEELKQHKQTGDVKNKVHKYTVTKTNDYSHCEERPTYTFTNVNPEMCTDNKQLPFLNSRMTSTCTMYHYSKNAHNFIHSCQSNESHELRSLSPVPVNATFVVMARRNLTFVKFAVQSTDKKKAGFKVKSSTLFSFEGLTKPSVIINEKEDINEIKGILQKLTKLVDQDKIAYNLMDHEVAKLYLHLIIHLRWRTKPKTFETIYSKYFKEYRFWLESALPFFGTEASGKEIYKRIDSGEITSQGVSKLLSRVGVVGQPEKGLCDHILKLCKSLEVKKNDTTSCWLAFGSLVRDYCRNKASCPQTYITTLKERYDENLHDEEHHRNTIKDNEKLVVALKAIGNAGQIKHLPLSLHILTTWDDNNAIMIAAIESLRMMPLEWDDLSKAQLALLNIFTNKTMCPEIRIVAFGALMDTGPNPRHIIRMTSIMKAEVSPLVKHYVYTYLNSHSKMNCPAMKTCKASIDLLARLSNVPREDFDPRFSFAVSHTMGMSEFYQLYRRMVHLERVHTPQSALARFLKITNTFKMKGLKFDHMEFKLRQREIVPLLRDLFGPYGSVYEKKNLWDFIRTRRSIDDNGFPDVYRRMQETINPKAKSDIPFKVTLSSKLFDSEIMYLVINETNQVIQDLIKDGTIKIDKDWWTNSLQAGMNFNLSANDLLFNSMLIVPTYTGIPLHFRVNMAGSVAYNFYGKVKSSPMLNLLSRDNKPTELSGTLKECFSMATYSNARMYWFYRDTRMGYEAHESLSTRCPFAAEKYTFKIEPPKQKLSFKAFVIANYTYSNSSLSVTRFARIKSKDQYTNGIKIDPKVLNQNSMSALFGSLTGGPGGPGGGPFMEGPKPGQRPFMGGPKPGQGPFMGGPKPGQGPFMGGPKPGQGPFMAGGPNPGQGRPMVGNVSAQGSEECNVLFTDIARICTATDNSERGYTKKSWMGPAKKAVENVEFLCQNLTSADDKKMRFNMELYFNGENNAKLRELHLSINTTDTSLVKAPLHGAPKYMGVSVKGYDVVAGKTKRMGCLSSSLNMTARRVDVGLGWGANCKQYNFDQTIIYNGDVSNPRLDIYSTWGNLPDEVERLTCPGRYMMKQMEKMKKMGSNGGMGAQGGMGAGQGGPGGMGRGQGQGQGGGGGGGQGGMGRGQGGGGGRGQGGMGPVPTGMAQGQGGMRPGQPIPGKRPGFGGPGPMPGLGQLPCLSSLNMSVTLKQGKTIVMTGFPTPKSEIFNYTLPVNLTKTIAKVKDVVTYGLTATCKAYRSTDNIITFDQRSYTYQPSPGCSHVLAKDCSKKDLFTVFMTRNSKNEKDVTLVIKDKKNIGHVFVIKADLTVEHDGKLLQLKGQGKHHSANVPHVCHVKKTDKNVVIKCQAGVTIIACNKKIKVKVTPWYFRYMCGLCGNYNWNPTDDIKETSTVESFGSSWLVPGKSCSSECKVAHRPEVEDKNGKLCVTTKPVTRCAPNCQATRTTTVKLGYYCIDASSDLASQTKKHIANKKFQKVINIFRNKSKDVELNTDVHVDCKCNCPK